MAFLLDLKNNFFSFYLMAVTTYGNQVTKLIVTRFVIVMNTEVPILKGFNCAFNFMLNNNYAYEKLNINKNIKEFSKDFVYNNAIIIDVDNHLNSFNDIIESSSDKISVYDIYDKHLTSNLEITKLHNRKNVNNNINDFANINFYDEKRKIMCESAEAIQYDLINVYNSESKIKLENFLTELFYFENLFKLISNFIRGFLINKIYEAFSSIGSTNEMTGSDLTNQFVSDLIKICFEIFYFDENFEILNKNSQFNFYDFPHNEEAIWGLDENINSIPELINSNNNAKLEKLIIHDNKVNDYYPNRNFAKKNNSNININYNKNNNNNIINAKNPNKINEDFNKNPNQINEDFNKNIYNDNKIKNFKVDSNNDLIGEYGLLRFSRFMELLFKNPFIDRFGMKLFYDYVNYSKEKRNFFFLKYIDNFFIVELDKIINICNGYRVLLNEFELNIPLTDLLVKSKTHAPKIEVSKITKSQCNISYKQLNQLLTFLMIFNF